jgi:malonate transporter
MVINSLFPVIIIVVLGYVLKRCKLTNTAFLKTSDRMVYFIFFPAMLFWKIGAAESTNIHWNFCWAAICAVVVIYFFSTVYILLMKVSDFQAGTFSQSCYRFNTYIGMAIIINALGETGVREFSILIGFLIPVINFLAVSTLIWFSGKNYSLHQRSRFIAQALISNPLILACLAGMLYAHLFAGFPVFIENSFQLAASMTLPLALLSVGAALTFENLAGNLKLSVVTSVFKLMLLPMVGFFFFKAFAVSPMLFKVGMILFSLPPSTAIYILSSQLNSDTDLASSAIVLSTVLSFLSLSIVLSAFV